MGKESGRRFEGREPGKRMTIVKRYRENAGMVPDSDVAATRAVHCHKLLPESILSCGKRDNTNVYSKKSNTVRFQGKVAGCVGHLGRGAGEGIV